MVPYKNISYTIRMESVRTANPRYVGAPPNMEDGRLFTDYRPSCEAIPVAKPVGRGQFSSGFDIRKSMIDSGTQLINEDRMFTTWVAGTVGRVDTMVPESQKRFCTWSGCETMEAQPVGLGTGRLVVDIPASADPDLIALKATPGLFDTFSSFLKGPHKNQRRVENTANRYSLPYGSY